MAKIEIGLSRTRPNLSPSSFFVACAQLRDAALKLFPPGLLNTRRLFAGSPCTVCRNVGKKINGRSRGWNCGPGRVTETRIRGSLPRTPAIPTRRKTKEWNCPGLPRAGPPLDGCLTGLTAVAERRLHPRQRQMEEVRPFEWIVTEKHSSQLIDQRCLSILSRHVVPRREVTSSVTGGVHVIMVQRKQKRTLPRSQRPPSSNFIHTRALTSSCCSTEAPWNPRVQNSTKKSRARQRKTPLT